MKVKCRICALFEQLPVVIVLTFTSLAGCYVFTSTAERVSDLEHDPAWLGVYRLGACMSVFWLLFLVVVLFYIVIHKLDRTLRRWRKECQRESEAT